MGLHYNYSLKKGIGIFTFPQLDTAGNVVHGFTARFGGVSEPPFDSLNLGFTRPEPRENIIENYYRLCDAYGLKYDSFVMVHYVHGSNIEVVTKKDCTKGFTDESLNECDAIITKEKGVTLITLHADCMPVFLFDPDTPAIGLIHAGWKGTFSRIGQKTVEKMAHEFGSKPERMFAGIGPLICFDCFEVDKTLAEKFIDEFKSSDVAKFTKPGKAHLDLAACMSMQLKGSGIKTVQHMHQCTYCNSELFSYRRDQGSTGAMAAFLALK